MREAVNSLSPLMLEKAGQLGQSGHPIANKGVMVEFSGPLIQIAQKTGPINRSTELE